jgi:2-polyprenyl-3-methyl-5-hydroxy-6-metoxy-1,4-benzoquinol methylase
MNRPSERDIATYFDSGIDCCAPPRDAAKRPGVELAKLLRRLLRDAGITGRDVLELGCGRGELSLELVDDGATSVTGVDLSHDAIEYARRRAAERGLARRTDFRTGNAATAELPAHDIVAHHRVICCYPDPAGFLARSIAAARSVYAFSMPRSQGLPGAAVRIAMRIENLGHRVKGRAFRAYVHDERIVDAAVRAAGFRLSGRSNRRGWFAAVYVRVSGSASGIRRNQENSARS